MHILLLTLTLLKIQQSIILTHSPNPFWSVLTFFFFFFLSYQFSTGLRAPRCCVSGFTCLEWEAIHGNLNWVEAEREYRFLCLWKNCHFWVKCLHLRKPYEGAAKGTRMWTSYGIVLVKLWKCTATLPSLQFPSPPFLFKWVCIYSTDYAPLRLTSSAAEGKPSHCSPSDRTLSSVALWLCQWFSYLAVPFFLMPLGLFFIPFTPTKLEGCVLWPLGCVAQQGSEGEFLSLDRPNLLPSLSCCDSKERSFLLTVSCGARLCFLPHTALSGCQPSSRLCDCCPEGECSFLPPWCCLLFSKHCSCTYPVSQPQQGSSVPICWQWLVKYFCWGKGHW